MPKRVFLQNETVPPNHDRTILIEVTILFLKMEIKQINSRKCKRRREDWILPCAPCPQALPN
jgi:hypothetical protein